VSWSCCTHTIRSLTLVYPFEIRKQSATEEDEERELECKARNMTVGDLTEGLELTEDAIKVFEYIKCDDLRVATSRQVQGCLL
jgi:hypothetical protein